MISAFCNDPTNDTVDLNYAGAFDVVVATGGVPDSVLRCSVDGSFSVGTVPSYTPISSAEFTVLWAAILGLFVAAVCVRYVIGVVR